MFYYFQTDDYHFNPSHITIGGWNMDKFSVSGSELVWHDNMSTFHWGVALTQFYINDEPVYSAREEPHEAILDSGNSYFNLPGAVYDDIYSKILKNTSCT